tara:strand:+ start:2790 stop:3992 length:1203 start_codon:yes stop_codon:yes gene_type:complete
MEQEMENVEEVQQEETTQSVDESKFESAGDDSVYKVDLSKPPATEEDEKPEEPKETTDDTANDTGVVRVDESTDTAEKQEEIQSEGEVQEEVPVVEEITEEEKVEVEEAVETVEKAIAEAEETGEPLPENIQKLIDFMEETGGDINDYVRLNQDYNKMDNLTALQEYYKITKPHLDAEERAFLMEENFSYNEEEDDEKDIRKKKIALKEQVAEAKAYLDGQKSKYYEEIKAGSKLTTEQQKAVDFFNRYNKESEETQAQQKTAKSVFDKKTANVFNDKFKGFEYKVGEKKYRFNVKNAVEVKNTQSDINNFVKKFLNEDGTMSDAKGYHKALHAAMNADIIAQHFYEQGKADALKQSVAKSKNVDMSPRQNHKTFEASGVKVRVVGNDSSDYKFKIRKNK